MELSKRLKAVAELVTPGMRLADVGTDHGYIPIYLTEAGVIPSAIAMDINKGPLERAKEHIREHGLEGKIQTRLSDGLKNLQMNEADCMIAAGMGGGLVIRILSEERDTAGSLKELILQPQSEIDSVRKYLTEEGYRIVAEDMVYEDGKYYPMMKAVPCMAGAGEIPYSEEELEFGRVLLQQAHPVLGQFLEREMEIQNRILSALESQESVRAKKRMEEISYRIEWIRGILNTYY
ncbi:MULTISPECIES: tRNA (adenine(22)-N(1))-methyltransferase [Lachnospiraceae]|uniref:tRNA (adenine(22)-N(1))-methyltransferase n=1 Tax=Lachnospiraceae TaxID=186803 RepID=UPI002A2CA563|nr:class I SAM-dependent methyltransferase [bacterium]MDY2885100.1 class I SAM-dependent methyltransferase [Bariatricus sp.]MDD6515707.1 class I SAM-dependent methyltransferase [bacterium]MDD7144069.1 class I SAM-dependent methyltransferase [bacterium]MDY4195229.1 class I SAM-dependent methyltransferase [Bariatricus sp.]